MVSKTFVSGLSWSFALRWFSRLLTLARLSLLARILLPAQFGVFAICTLVLAFLEIITETWINIFLVQRSDRNINAYIDTAWVVSILRGLVIAVAIAASAPLISGFFRSPPSLSGILLISLVPLIRGFINPSVVKLQKNLEFQKEFFLSSSIFISESVLAISMALASRSYLALIIAMIFSALIEVIVTLTIFSPRPSLRLNQTHLKEIFHFGKWVTPAGIFNYAYQHGDDIVVGKILGESSLGVYQYAYKLSSLPLTEIGDVFAKVSFPLYTQMRKDSKLLRQTFIRTSLIVSLVAALAGTSLFLFAHPIISILLGQNWLAAVPVLKVLTLYGVAKTVSGTTFPLFLASGHQEYVTWVTLTSLLILGLTILPSVVTWGLVGAGLSATLGALLSLPLAIIFSFRLLKS